MIQNKSSLIVRKASAGAGKTFTLVKEYIKLAFSGRHEEDLDQQFARILAITFTNKAANEMKERIMGYLEEIASEGAESGMAQAINNDTGMDFARMQRYAARVKRAILHNYSELSVCTIDSFMHRIVKTFAHDLDLPMNFEVLLDNSDLIQTSIDDLMGRLGQAEEEELTQMLCSFAEDQMEEGRSFRIEDRIAELAKELFTEGVQQQLEAYKEMAPSEFEALQKKLRRDNRELEQQIASEAKEALKAMKEAQIEKGHLYQGAKGIGGYMEKAAKGEMAKGNTYVLAFVEGDHLWSGSCPQEERPQIEALQPILAAHYRRIEELLDDGLALYNSRMLILKNIYSLAVLNRLDQIAETESHANEMVHISEFNSRIAQVVQEEPMPFIYERVGSRYAYVLIDEFQDTSKQQWQNLMPLVSNAVDSGHTCLIVGDGKQAIYRFRKGDVEQFVRLPEVEVIHDHGRVFTQPGIADVDNIKENWRTRDRVVAFNNEFYAWAAHNAYGHNAEIQRIYIGGDAEHPELEQLAQKDGGYVQIGFADTKEGGTNRLWDAMLADIRRQVEVLHYKYSDITILGRDNKVLSAISSYFAQNPDHGELVPMVSSESFLLKNSRVVILMRAVLHYLLDNRDRVAATQVLVLLQQMGKTTHDFTQDLLDKGNDYLIDLHAILAHDGIDFDAERLRSMTLYDCCEEIVRRLQLSGMDTAYTASMLNIAAAYSRSHRQDLAEFLEWFDKKLDTLASNSAGAQNAIRLMTIHKSKGLESKIILYAIPPTGSKSSSLWVKIDREELGLKTCLVTPKKDAETVFQDQISHEEAMSEMDDLNVLYVATTRPRSKLMIYSSMPPQTSSGNSYQKMLWDYTHGQSRLEWREADDERMTRYELGEDINYADKEEAGVGNTSVEQLTYDGWPQRVEIAEQARRIFDTASMERIEEGVTLHEIFAKMRNKNDADAAIEEYAKEQGLDEQKTLEISSQIAKLMRNEGFAKFFDPRYECINECNMVMDYEEEDGTRGRGVRRPDRIVLADGETWVVDFKTGSESKKHQQQVRNYCNAISEMGYPGVKGYLLYIHKGYCQIMPVE
ncbi:MAG: UvrD-helicase domain-containing protein [Bacteroidales bacterium]|nr:UvrD-helicase domain-containing protein [Bacteroidales bacterium]